ncbi:nitroreductase [Sedimenticola selenatireducens]|uniref:Nitroreductase n=1 Tax=Sedimenticola selenatireducens TaxID=191960 RepID=A0A558DLA0_9GAMM|nr:nitroreductase [Sedimenticola selenatireducens]TVO67705.1 nitroreductase [Sedimenticola selenatireducens]TVT61783.1 MAG: nitroreductase [Sedimenticola selenatireducens]
MTVCESLLLRKATRAFQTKEVEQEKIVRILDAARHAPSGTNTQPWQVAVVTGEMRRKLGDLMETAFRGGQQGKMEFQYYPEIWEGIYKERRRACGLQMYSTLQISRDDKQRQLDQWAANYRSFDAPVMMFFFIDEILETGSYLDYGMFIQSIMLMAVEEGLATCPQAALGEYPEIVKQELGYPDDKKLVVGLAMGYEDTSAIINQYRTPRDAVEQFTRFFD